MIKRDFLLLILKRTVFIYIKKIFQKPEKAFFPCEFKRCERNDKSSRKEIKGDSGKKTEGGKCL